MGNGHGNNGKAEKLIALVVVTVLFSWASWVTKDVWEMKTRLRAAETMTEEAERDLRILRERYERDLRQHFLKPGERQEIFRRLDNLEKR